MESFGVVKERNSMRPYNAQLNGSEKSQQILEAINSPPSAGHFAGLGGLFGKRGKCCSNRRNRNDPTKIHARLNRAATRCYRNQSLRHSEALLVPGYGAG
jgi:hypothetical protein